MLSTCARIFSNDPKEQQAFQAKYNAKLPQTFEDFENLTMDEFEKVADFFTRPDKQLWGTAMQYSRVYDFITCNVYNFMFSLGGEIWDPKTGQVEGILNSDVNAKALEQCKHWLKYQPPGALNYGISEEIDVFTQSKVFSCFNWAAVGLAMITPENKDKVMVVPPPKMGQGASAKRVYTIGGQPWVINAFNDPSQDAGRDRLHEMVVFAGRPRWNMQSAAAIPVIRRPCRSPSSTGSTPGIAPTST